MQQTVNFVPILPVNEKGEHEINVAPKNNIVISTNPFEASHAVHFIVGLKKALFRQQSKETKRLSAVYLASIKPILPAEMSMPEMKRYERQLVLCSLCFPLKKVKKRQLPAEIAASNSYPLKNETRMPLPNQ